jgi:transposase
MSLQQEVLMSLKQRIERVDNIPLILYWLKQMGIVEIIDATFTPHTNWQSLSYGQLAVLFLTYVLHKRTHCLSAMEEWVQNHRVTLQRLSGFNIGKKEATDDRLGRLLEVLGENEEKSTHFQRQLGQHLIQAYALPTEIARYDTTSFSVHHTPQQEEADKGLLRFGHSKDKRPDLVQFKQGLGTLDPAGVPLLTGSLPGNQADDPLYVPAWRQMVQTIGNKQFLFVADCKAAALATRAVIDHEGGWYLFPLPMTGEIPGLLCEWIANPPHQPEAIRLADVTDEQGQPCTVGQGFTVSREMETQLDSGQRHSLHERFMVTQSTALAQRQQKALKKRLEKAENELSHLRPKPSEHRADVQVRAERILKQRKVEGLLSITVQEKITVHKKYIGPGRPGPNRAFKMVEKCQVNLHVKRDEQAIQQAMQLTGWRIYVTNTLETEMPLSQAITYYRDEWRLERGYHRFKKGSLPALPLFVRLDERIRGLMLLLMVALQVLTLLEFVAHRQLAVRKETIAGLVPGNPKMSTARPSAERILAQFTSLHLLIEETETLISCQLLEKLTPLQCRLLYLLNVPETLYSLTFNQ